MSESIKYPRRSLIRWIIRNIVGGLLKLLTRPEIKDLDNFPDQGPLIVIGNHTGAMEVVLMGVFATQPMEFFAAMDMPWNDWMGKVIDLYGIIPVYRGYASPSTMRSGLEALSQGAILGIFPEGGFWEPGNQQARTGAAWLSYKSGAPILPIGFGDTRGLMTDAFRLKFPRIEMNVGHVLPAVELDPAHSKKRSLERSANQIMEAVWDLVPKEEKNRKAWQPRNEIFSLTIRILNRERNLITLPEKLVMTDGGWISRYIHRPNLIDMMRDYVFPEIQVLKELHQRPSAEAIYQAVDRLLTYVEDENPQYFNYRYGLEDGMAFQKDFEQLRDVLGWVIESAFTIEAEAVYEYVDPESGEQKRIHIPEDVAHW